MNSTQVFILSVVMVASTLINNSTAQNTPDKEKVSFRYKKNQNSFEYAPLAHISYRYAHRFSPNFRLGFGFAVGGLSVTVPDNYFDFPKLSLFYRLYIKDKTSLDLGAFFAIVHEGQPFRGFESEIFYGWENIKIGQGVQAGYFDDQMSDYGGEEFVLLIRLLILRVDL